MIGNLDLKWMKNKDCWHWENDGKVLNDDAPEEMRKSYEHYLEQIKSGAV